MKIQQSSMLSINDIYFGTASKEGIATIKDVLFSCTMERVQGSFEPVKKYMRLFDKWPLAFTYNLDSDEITIEGSLLEMAQEYNADLLLSTFIIDGRISIGKLSAVYQTILNNKYCKEIKRQFIDVWASTATVYLLGAYGVPEDKKEKFSAMLKQLLFNELLTAENSTTIIYVNKVEKFLDTKIRQAALYAGYSEDSLEQLRKIAPFDFIVTQTKIAIKKKGEQQETVLEERNPLYRVRSKSSSHIVVKSKTIYG